MVTATRACAALLLLGVLGLPVLAAANNTEADEVRGYIGLRIGESNPVTDAHDVYGASLGVDWGRFLGLELGLDSYELFLEGQSGWKSGELAVLGITPAVRLRMPVLGDRFVPYALAGGGVALLHLNDAPFGAALGNGTRRRTRAMGSFGLGFDFFLQENVAVGVEGKYFLVGTESFEGEFGEEGEVNLNVPLLTFGIRALWPERPPEPEAEPQAPGGARLYLAIGAGGVLPTHTSDFAGFEVRAEQPFLGSSFTVAGDAAFGVEWGRHAAIELALLPYELQLASTESEGAAGEYSVWPLLVQGRLRWPLADGRWEPFVVGGIGATVTELNDTNGHGRESGLGGNTVAVSGSLGAGLDWRFQRNAALTFQTKYLFGGRHTIEFEESRIPGRVQGLSVTLGLRIFLADLG